VATPALELTSDNPSAFSISMILGAEPAGIITQGGLAPGSKPKNEPTLSKTIGTKRRAERSTLMITARTSSSSVLSASPRPWASASPTQLVETSASTGPLA
jgi:hypothetical protein